VSERKIAVSIINYCCIFASEKENHKSLLRDTEINST